MASNRAASAASGNPLGNACSSCWNGLLYQKYGKRRKKLPPEPGPFPKSPFPHLKSYGNKAKPPKSRPKSFKTDHRSKSWESRSPPPRTAISCRFRRCESRDTLPAAAWALVSQNLHYLQFFHRKFEIFIKNSHLLANCWAEGRKNCAPPRFHASDRLLRPIWSAKCGFPKNKRTTVSLRAETIKLLFKI